MINLKNKIVASAFCIATFFCFSQENKSGVCRLGELKNDSLLPFITSVKLDCSTADLQKFKASSSKLNSLSSLIIKGEASAEDWEDLFKEIKRKAKINSVVFDNNTFSLLPYGFENLYNIEQLVISNNDEMDYDQTFQQLASLPNLKEITLDIYSILDLPDSLFLLKNITKISLINKDEELSENDFDSISSPKTPLTYDFNIKKGENNFVAIKYISLGGKTDSIEYAELANRFNENQSITEADKELTATSSIADNQAYKPIYNFVKPPIAGLDVERKNYSINSGIDNVLVSPSGTKILIPADAFIDQEGKSVKGSIILNYREFRDPVDFLVSGIPMKYKSDGVVNDFESAGMFEITASTNQQPLNLAPGKQIKMNFVSTSPDSTYNFYSYNDSVGNWELKTKPKKVTATTKINEWPLSTAYSHYKQLLKSAPTKLITASLEERYKSPDYVYTSRLDNNNQTKKYQYRKKGKQYSKRVISLVRLVRIKKTKEGTVLFKLRYFHETHPELSVFNNIYFETKENISPLLFRNNYLCKQLYNDVRIYQKDDEMEIHLKGINNYKTIDARAVTLNDKHEVKKVKFFENKMKCYNRNLKNRGRRFKNYLKHTNEPQNYTAITDPKELSLYAYSKCKKTLNNTEKKMSKDDCISYFNQMLENEKQMVSSLSATSNNLLCSLTLDGMGIYNCDQIQRIVDPVEVLATYENARSNKLSPNMTYIINKKVNGVYQYDGSYGYTPNKVAFSNSADAQNVLLTVNTDGTMAIFKTEDFKNNSFTHKSRFTFKVQEMNSKNTTVAELKKTIGL